MRIICIFRLTKPHYILEESNFNFRYIKLCDLDIPREKRKMAKLFANRGDPDQMSHSVVSHLGLHCLPITLLGVSRLKWVIQQIPTCSNFTIGITVHQM